MDTRLDKLFLVTTKVDGKDVSLRIRKMENNDIVVIETFTEESESFYGKIDLRLPISVAQKLANAINLLLS